jgi:hypothetical protein
MGSLTGGKGGSSQQAAPAAEPQQPASNPALDMYLQEQANQNQQALQQQQMNAQLMQAQQTPVQQPGMHPAQVQEQQGMEQQQQPGRDVWATIDALRGN